MDQNTGEEIPGVDRVVTTYKQGENYTTEKKEISGYTYTKDSGNTTGQVADKDIEVVYYYKKTSAGSPQRIPGKRKRPYIHFRQ